MIIQKRCVFIMDAVDAIVSYPVYNNMSDVLVLEIQGDDGEYVIEGRASDDGVWVPLAGINVSNYKMSPTQTSAGVYEYSVIGLRELRAKVISTSGTVTLLGQLINSMEG